VVLDTENPGDVLSWTTDPDFVIRAATAFNLKTAETTLRVRDGKDQPWRNLVVWPFEQMGMYGQINGGTVVADFDSDGNSLFGVSALHSDTQRLVRIDVHTGKEIEVLAEHAQSDVAEDFLSFPDFRPLVMNNPGTHAVEAVAFEYLQYDWRVLDPAVRADFDVLQKAHPGSFFVVISRDHANSKWVVAENRSDGPLRFYMYDRTSKQAAFLFTPRPEFDDYTLTQSKPVLPAGWEAVKTRWVRRMGDVEHDEVLNRELSPLYHVDQIRIPMLIGQGANDPRVNINNSDVIVEALRKKNIAVTYIVYPDEGHGFARPENNLDFFGRAEDFLGQCLGGRAEHWVKVPGSTAEVR
jgi:pimeloyl-ACP methyl ester carboxylesterase